MGEIGSFFGMFFFVCVFFFLGVCICGALWGCVFAFVCFCLRVRVRVYVYVYLCACACLQEDSTPCRCCLIG